MTELSPKAVQAARGLLGWSLRDLKEQAGVSLPTLVKLEAGGSIAPETEERLRDTLQAAGSAILTGEMPDQVAGLALLGIQPKGIRR